MISLVLDQESCAVAHGVYLDASFSSHMKRHLQVPITILSTLFSNQDSAYRIRLALGKAWKLLCRPLFASQDTQELPWRKVPTSISKVRQAEGLENYEASQLTPLTSPYVAICPTDNCNFTAGKPTGSSR